MEDIEYKNKIDELRKNMPATWRQEDFDIWEKLSSLQAAIAVSRKREDALRHSSDGVDKNIIDMADSIQYIVRQLRKLDEVYYHIFPDRLVQDMRFDQQMDALNSKPDPDANLKKT